MRRYLAKALALLLVAFSASALAMGLGDIRLNSYLNQRLDAEIELVSAAADEIDTLVVELADRDAFERVGLERPAILSSLEFKVVRRPNGTAYIKVTSDEAIREPFLTFLVEADWSRGRLLREYTLLLDPPTFADESEPAEARSPAVTPTPSVTPEPAQPTPQPVQREEAVVDTADEPEALESEPMEPAPAESATEAEKPMAEEEVVAESAAEEEAVSIPPLEADREERRQPVYRQAPDIGDSYGPIQRNETLWSIASRMRPDDSVTMNQMMVAIYRANPEAFAGNMNRMKQGYILRIPDFNEVTSLSRSEAFRSAKQMNEEWDASRGRVATEDFRTEPEADDSLSLVAPEEDVEPEVGTGVGAGGEAGDVGAPGDAAVELDEDDVDAGAVDLVEDEAETADRLIDIEDESMQAVQAGAGEDESAPDAMDEQVADEVMPEDELADTEGEVLDELPPLPAEGMEEPTDTMAGDDMADEAMADDTMADEDTVGEGETVDAEAADVAEPPAEEETAQTQPDRSAVVTTSREPEKGLVDKVLEFALSTIGLAVIGVILVLILGVIALMQRRRKAAKEQAASEMADWLADEEGDSEDTVVAGADDDDATVVAGGSEDVTEGGDDFDGMFGSDEEREGSDTEAFTEGDDDTESTQMISPEDRPEPTPESDSGVGGETVTLDENDPLSEADFNMAYGLYDQAADVVQKAADREPDRADLHAKLCEIHFAANNKDEFMDAARKLKEVAGADSEEWSNVAIMGQQIAPHDDLFAGGGGGSAGVDLDFGSEDEGETDFEATMTGSPAADDSASSEPAADSSAGGDDLDFDLDIGDLGGEESTPAKEPASSSEEATSDTGGDLDFDLDFDSSGEEDSSAEEKPEPAADTGSSDDSDDFDLGDLGDMDLGDMGGDEEEPDFSVGSDDESPAADDDESYDSDNTQTEFDKALSELSAYVDTNLPEGGAGDEVSSDEGSGGDDLNLDDFNFDKESESLGDDDELGGGGEDDDDEGLGEIGTKLDLARAYVDMGDPDGARSILEEVLEDGDEQQKQEAQDLLDKL